VAFEETSLPTMAPLSKDSTDAELIAQVLAAASPQAAGDAYRILLERHWKVVVILLRSRVGSARDAEDLAQESFLRAWRSLHKLENAELFLGWLLRIAQNLATDHLRRRRTLASIESLRESGYECSVAMASEGLSPQERLESEEQMQLVLDALGKLPERYRTVVTLRFLKNLSGQEMARVLGEPEGTLRNRLFRALGKLRKIIDQQKVSKT
jgi:RNA polymerase sigma-70 factor (ECF subfamily)